MSNNFKKNGFVIALTIFAITSLNFQPLNSQTMDTCSDMVRKLAIVEVGQISLWIHKAMNVLIKNATFPYDSSNELIENPTFINKGDKLLYAKNIIAEDRGVLVMFDLNSRNEKIVYQGHAIKSPSISNNEKYVAFLSDRDTRGGYSLYVLEVSSSDLKKIVNSGVYGEGYNLNISWLYGDENILYSDVNGHINTISFKSLNVEKITYGYSPIASHDGKMIIVNQKGKKPYNPMIYYMETGNTKVIKSKRVFNATWVPNRNCILIVRNVSSIFRWNEWEKEVVMIDVNNLEEEEILKFEGFENIGVTEYLEKP